MRYVVNMLHMLSYGEQGGCDNVLDEYNKGPTELVAAVNMLHMLSYGQEGGGGGCDSVLDEFNTGPTELVAVVNMLHMLSYGQQGGGGGVIAFLTSLTQGPRNLLPLLTCFRRALGGRMPEPYLALMLRKMRKNGWNLVDVCMGNLKIINSPLFFVLEEQKLIHCAGEMQIFELESHCLPIEMNVHVANIF